MSWRTRGVIALSNAYRRLLAIALHIVGPRVAYLYYRTMARLLYRLVEPLRRRCVAQCRTALGERYAPEEIERIAAESFVHRSLNLADLLLADRRITADTYGRVGGQIPEPYLGLLHEAQSRDRAIILVTAYYGPFDLLPLLLGYNGIHASVVYKPHPNAGFDAYRRRIRTRSGCVAIPVEQALSRLPDVLEAGGAAAILADHHAQRGVPVTFLGLPTNASRAVALLAARYDAVVAVAAIRRTAQPFHFQIVVADYFEWKTWASTVDPVVEITKRYTAALERIVVGDPAQYLWAHLRWREASIPEELA